jgi:hypothetical protein
MTGAGDGPGRPPAKGTNGLALVAGALIALLVVLGFLALMSRRSGAQQRSAVTTVIRESTAPRTSAPIAV